jgi:hypothetical protein
MTISDLLEKIREPYVRILAASVREQPAHIEPAYRQASGALATEGLLELPCRADFIPTEKEAPEPFTVDSKTQLQFEPVSFTIGNTSIELSPFGWDWAQIKILGLSNESAFSVLKSWFLHWFDEEDQNSENEEGLFGVMHFMSEPEIHEEEICIAVDLGSAPAESIEDLMFRVSDAGAKELHVG